MFIDQPAQLEVRGGLPYKDTPNKQTKEDNWK